MKTKIPRNVQINEMNVETISRMYNNQDFEPGYDKDFTTWLTNWYDMYNIFRFIRTRVLDTKSNWKCKHCKNKIIEPIQIQTSESHCPVYHIKCYMELRELIFMQLNIHKDMLESQITLMENKNERVGI